MNKSAYFSLSGIPTSVSNPSSGNVVSKNADKDAGSGTGNSPDSDADNPLDPKVPVLSYEGAVGTIGIVNQPLLVSPTKLASNGSAITACGVRVPTTALPSWANVNSSTCVISGTSPDTLPETTYTLVATNKVGKSAEAIVNLAIQPMLNQQAYIKPFDSKAGAFFGRSVAIFGNTLVVGSSKLNEGLVPDSFDPQLVPTGVTYVFVQSGTTWSMQALLKPDQLYAFGFGPRVGGFGYGPRFGFGYAVGISGDTLIVADPDDMSSSFNGTGAVYIYVRNGATWSPQGYIKPSTVMNANEFGYSVAISGNTIVVGARGEENGGGSRQGAVYVFSRSGTAWSQQARITLSSTRSFLGFGSAVAISGDTIVVGIDSDDSNQSTITNGSTASTNTSLGGTGGAAYVYTRSGITWSQQAYIKPPNPRPSTAFGRAIAISEDTIVVGDQEEKSNQSTITNGNTASTNTSFSESGAAYVFTRSGTNWSQQAYLKASNVSGNSHFGESVSISGNTIAMSAPGEPATYEFSRSGTTWSQRTYLKHLGQQRSLYGNSVDISGDTIVSADCYDRSNQSTITNGSAASTDTSLYGSGAVYIYSIGVGVPTLSYSHSSGTTIPVNQPMSVTPSILASNGSSITACGIQPGSANAASFPGTLSVNASTCVISGTPTAGLPATAFTLVGSNSVGSAHAVVTLTIQ